MKKLLQGAGIFMIIVLYFSGYTFWNADESLQALVLIGLVLGSI